MCFRSAVFNLCKKCLNNPQSLKIRELIHDISIINNKNDSYSCALSKPSHGDLAYISEHKRIQFLGYLLTDESVEEINKNDAFSATHLSENERYIMETAYLSIKFFIDTCIKDLKNRFPHAYSLINPYGIYISPQLKTKADSIFSEGDLQECANAFKNGKLYKRIVDNDTMFILENATEDVIKSLSVVFDNQFTNDLSNTTVETEEFIRKLQIANPTAADVLYLYGVYCYALKTSLRNAIQMIYEAILGKEFLVLNNDNIIKIEPTSVSEVYEKTSILCQDILIGHCVGLTTNVGSIVLLDCNYATDYHIKKFGYVISETINFGGEFGESTKLQIVIVDEDLNPIYMLTERACNSKIGSMKVIYNKQ